VKKKKKKENDAPKHDVSGTTKEGEARDANWSAPARVGREMARWWATCQVKLF
jgi:hypothetical protein